MGWISLILYRFTGLLCGKKLLISRTEINTDFKKLVRSHRTYSIKSMIRINFDLKPGILRLFFWAYWIDGVLFACSIVANIFYTSLFFYLFFGIKISGIDKTDISWNWIGTFIINFLVILFFIRNISDYYKLSLRDKYHDNYLKLLWLDIFTLNFLNIIGTLIFIKNRKHSNLNQNNQKIKQLNLSSKPIKDFSKVVTKIEVFILLFNLILFAGAILIGYFVSINSIKIVCTIIIVWNIAFIQGWSFQKIAGLIIIQKMLKNLLNDSNYYLLFTIIRFLGLNFGYYYLVIFLNLLKFDESTKEFILENW